MALTVLNKIGTASILDNAITSGKIINNAVTSSKIVAVAGGKILQTVSVSFGDPVTSKAVYGYKCDTTIHTYIFIHIYIYIHMYYI